MSLPSISPGPKLSACSKNGISMCPLYSSSDEEGKRLQKPFFYKNGYPQSSKSINSIPKTYPISTYTEFRSVGQVESEISPVGLVAEFIEVELQELLLHVMAGVKNTAFGVADGYAPMGAPFQPSSCLSLHRLHAQRRCHEPEGQNPCIPRAMLTVQTMLI